MNLWIKNFMKKHIRKIKIKLSTELCLLSRLRLVSYILYLLSLTSLVYALVHNAIPCIEDDLAKELSPHDAFNFYIVSFLFFCVGCLCFYISKKRQSRIRKHKK